MIFIILQKWEISQVKSWNVQFVFLLQFFYTYYVWGQ